MALPTDDRTDGALKEVAGVQQRHHLALKAARVGLLSTMIPPKVQPQILGGRVHAITIERENKLRRLNHCPS